MSDGSKNSDGRTPSPSFHPAYRGCPVLAVCGYSGSGKTTLIESVLPDLAARGWSVLVVKQDAHQLVLDREGKDTDRLFRAGADVLIRDAQQAFLRLQDPEKATLELAVSRYAADYDLILVEGHKSTALPWKIWLTRDEGETPPPGAVGIRRVIGPREDRKAILLAVLDECMMEAANAVPVYAGILIGGASRRMGRPKHLIMESGQTWLERTAHILRPWVHRVVLLGGGVVPDGLRHLIGLPDAEDGAGPIRGMRAAMRWAPRVSWLFVACDLPRLTAEAIEWILSFRRPGVRAVIPMQSETGEAQPLLAWYDFRMAPVIERVERPKDLAGAPGVQCPRIPSALGGAWRNVNAPDDISDRC